MTIISTEKSFWKIKQLVDKLKDSRHDASFGLLLGDQIFYRFFLAILVTVSGWLVPVSSLFLCGSRTCL